MNIDNDRFFKYASFRRRQKFLKKQKRKQAFQNSLDFTMPILLMVLGVLFLFSMFGCSTPITLEHQKILHNQHVLIGDFYGACMFCQGEINFLLGHSTTVETWEDKVFRY